MILQPGIRSLRLLSPTCSSLSKAPIASTSTLTPLLRPRQHLGLAAFTTSQRRHAGREPTKVTEDEQLYMARRKSDEGSIMAVQSGLFKLLLPVPNASPNSLARRLTPRQDDSALLFLLHPKQPLSTIATLIEAEISTKDKRGLEVTFHGVDEQLSGPAPKATPQTLQWAQATELGDFVQDAAKDRKFVIAINEHGETEAHVLKIRVPSFEERTQFLRERLVNVTGEMQSLLEIKQECDHLALKGARRMAMAGFGGLIGYWGVVYFLTFHVYGWDLMEPVTYLTGLTGIMGGYLWFLFNQKEISYRSVFEMSSSKRREQLYDQKGFDRRKWQDLVDEGTELRRAIKRIAHDYSVDWSMERELEDEKAAKEIKKHEDKKHGPSDEKKSGKRDDDKDKHASARSAS